MEESNAANATLRGVFASLFAQGKTVAAQAVMDAVKTANP
jgi:hypothetical protein